jgi:hypothetical protein
MAGESGRLTRLGNIGGGSSLQHVEADTSGAVITLNFGNDVQVSFSGSDVIDGNRSVALSNNASALQMFFEFELDAPHSIAFPANFRMSDALWDALTHTWTSLDAGRFQASAIFDGTLWNMQIVGPFS